MKHLPSFSMLQVEYFGYLPRYQRLLIVCRRAGYYRIHEWWWSIIKDLLRVFTCYNRKKNRPPRKGKTIGRYWSFMCVTETKLGCLCFFVAANRCINILRDEVVRFTAKTDSKLSLFDHMRGLAWVKISFLGSSGWDLRRTTFFDDKETNSRCSTEWELVFQNRAMQRYRHRNL